MAKTPASTCKSAPLMCIIDNLNQPDVDLEEEGEVDKNTLLADLSIEDIKHEPIHSAKNCSKNLEKLSVHNDNVKTISF
jgi:hypothetical protein